jgi:hypothetical protein
MVKKEYIIIIGIVLLFLVAGNSLFSLFPNSGCGLVGVIKNNEMCLPNGHWSGILDCTNGKCGIRETTNVRGMCNWLDLECRDKNIYMCSRNGVFSSIGKISGYCGYNTENQNPPPVATCSDNEEMCVGIDYYNCHYNSFTYVGNVDGKCGYTSPSNTGTGTGTGTGTTAGFGGFPNIPMQYIYIGIAILVVIVVLSFVKKK